MATRKTAAQKKKEAAEKAAAEKAAEGSKQIKATDFVPIWQSSATAADVNEHFGKDPDGLWASSFAARMRSKGVDLKKMKRKGGGGGKTLDIDELNALAKSNLKEED